MNPQVQQALQWAAVLAISGAGFWIKHLLGELKAARATIEAKNEVIREKDRQLDKLEITGNLMNQFFNSIPAPRDESSSHQSRGERA